MPDIYIQNYCTEAYQSRVWFVLKWNDVCFSISITMFIEKLLQGIRHIGHV